MNVIVLKRSILTYFKKYPVGHSSQNSWRWQLLLYWMSVKILR